MQHPLPSSIPVESSSHTPPYTNDIVIYTPVEKIDIDHHSMSHVHHHCTLFIDNIQIICNKFPFHIAFVKRAYIIIICYFAVVLTK